MTKVCLIEFNEVNFDLVIQYVKDYRLVNFEALLELNSITTTAESEYSKLEPWIQWTSVHTCMDYNEHGVFRLGDINNFSGKQIFEEIEERGHSVGVVCAMNAKNNLTHPKYFIPDPWTSTSPDSSAHSQQIYDAIKQAVNDNASGKISKKSYLHLFINMIRYSQKHNWLKYIKLVMKSFKRKWFKALFLDLFLSDLHIKYYKKHNPDFTVLFLNGLAHVQHHYFFNSKYYTGKNKNPEWYVADKDDPILDALQIYDAILGDVFKNFHEYKLIIATGLSQEAFTHTKFYYRLSDHKEFLKLIDINFKNVYPRMTRDFLIEFDDTSESLIAEKILEELVIDGEPMFGIIDNRGTSLFVTLTYDREITERTILHIKDNDVKLKELVDFVAIKNGHHTAKGYVYSNEILGLPDGGHVKQLGQVLLQSMPGN